MELPPLLSFEQFLNRPELADWKKLFSETLEQHVHQKKHGHLAQWLDIIESLPTVQSQYPQNKITQLDQDTISVGSQSNLSTDQAQALETGLRDLMPWRKGPYQLFGTCLLYTSPSPRDRG